MIFVGLGLAISQRLLSQSHNVVVLARSVEPLANIKTRFPQQVAICAGDLADFSLAQKAIDTAVKEFGQVDGIIINHGVLEPVTKLADSDPEVWRKSFDINVFSAIALVSENALNKLKIIAELQ